MRWTRLGSVSSKKSSFNQPHKMPTLLALEWDANEARVVVAKATGTSVTFERALAIDLSPSDPGEEGDTVQSADEVGQTIESAIADLSIGKAEVLCCVGRSNIELRFLRLPDAPEDELPSMVRMQATQQFAHLSDDSVLDFIPLEEVVDSQPNVLAASLAKSSLDSITSACDAADLAPSHIVLRPFSAASLIRRTSADNRCLVSVDVVGDEADISVLRAGHLIFTRTVRVTTDSHAIATTLIAEVRRTIVAARNQMSGDHVEHLEIFGIQSNHRQFGELAEKELNLSVAYFDPFAGQALSRSLRDNLPQNRGKFAPLIGVVLDEVDASHAIDFLSPRTTFPVERSATCLGHGRRPAGCRTTARRTVRVFQVANAGPANRHAS